MKKYSCVLFVLLPFLIAFGQNYQSELIQKSIQYLRKEDLKNFRNTYPKLYYAYVKDNTSQYKNAVEETKNNKIGIVIKNLDSLINDDFFLDEIGTDKNFEKLHKEKEWRDFIDRIKTKKIKYNNALRLQLKTIQNEDQGIRILYLESKKINWLIEI